MLFKEETKSPKISVAHDGHAAGARGLQHVNTELKRAGIQAGAQLRESAHAGDTVKRFPGQSLQGGFAGPLVTPGRGHAQGPQFTCGDF